VSGTQPHGDITSPLLLERVRTARGSRAYRVITLEGRVVARFEGAGALRAALTYRADG
jgi:hypothetical protein